MARTVLLVAAACSVLRVMEQGPGQEIETGHPILSPATSIALSVLKTYRPCMLGKISTSIIPTPFCALPNHKLKMSNRRPFGTLMVPMVLLETDAIVALFSCESVNCVMFAFPVAALVNNEVNRFQQENSHIQYGDCRI